jgi:hypothetical protein
MVKMPAQPEKTTQHEAVRTAILSYLAFSKMGKHGGNREEIQLPALRMLIPLP